MGKGKKKKAKTGNILYKCVYSTDTYKEFCIYTRRYGYIRFETKNN